MYANMFFKMLSQSESFVAIVASKRTLVSMNHLMTMKVFKKSKSTAASLALMRSSFITLKLRLVTNLRIRIYGNEIFCAQLFATRIFDN